MPVGPHPEFAWSVSRASLFEFCPRKYYYRYYGMWGGWEENTDERTRLTYLLSRRTSLASWVGQQVHRAIALFLCGDEPMARIVDQTRNRMRDQFRLSRSRRFLEPGQAKLFGLTEHYYQHELPDETVRQRWAQVEACLSAFERAPYRDDAKAARCEGRLVHIENPDETDFDAMSFVGHGLGDFRIYAHPDFVITHADCRTSILDWKTGRPRTQGQDRVSGQLGFYALWAREKLGVDVGALGGRLEAYEVYWPGAESRGDRLDTDSLEAALDYARSSVAEMKARLRDPSANAAVEGDFEALASEAKCAVCDFRAVCPDRS